MKAFTLLYALFLFAAPAWAQWTMVSRESMPSAAGTDFTRLQVQQGSDSAELYVFKATASGHTLAVLDNAAGESSVKQAGESAGAVAVVNGGYFHPDHIPLGLVIAGGETLHPLERAKLLSGIVVASSHRVTILRAGEYQPSATVRTALQAGPFLIDRALPVTGLNATRSAHRTVVFASGGGAFGVVLCRSATLAEMADILALHGLVPGMVIQRALNLDGGTSSGLWVRQPSGAFSIPEFKKVRNYLAIVPR